MESGIEDGNAVHLAFHQDDVVEAADGLLGKVEIEENARLAVDGRLGRVEILGAGFFVAGQGTPGEGDNLATFIADGKDDAVAKLAVERGGGGFGRIAGARVFSFLPTEQAAFAQDVFIGRSLELVAEEITGLRGEANAEAGDGFVVEAAATQIFAGGGALGTGELLLKPEACSLVQVEQKAAGACLASFLRRVELGLGRTDAQLLGNGADGFGEGDVLDLLDEREDVAGNSAAEAVKVLAGGVDGK